ncbi:MAG TPA: glycosyltransferase family 2 protein [Gammaproteobacteria bacterium]|nr:glycosyltransferase family 2 protein [Gammaproteobacteria bacterium]
MMHDKVAAVVLNYRTPRETYECIESLALEGVSDAVIVDNSEDAGQSAARIEELIECGPVSLKLWIERPSKNLGFAAGVNRGLGVLREHVGKCAVLLINSDAKAIPGMLAKMREAVGPADAAAIVGTSEFDQQGQPRDNVRHYHRALGLTLRRPMPGTFRYLSGSCMLIPASLSHPPLFDEDFFFYGEDVELSWRLSHAGVRMIQCESARVIHVGGRSSKPYSFFYEYHIALGHLILARKLACGKLERVLFTLLRFLTLWSRALLRSFRARQFTPLSACMHAYMAKHRAVAPDSER